MKNPSAVPDSIRNSVVILRCRGVELGAADRQELQRTEVALGHVFRRIHRIEWKFVGRSREVGLRCDIQSLSGPFTAVAVGESARAALRSVAQKILKQKRRSKTISVTRRRAVPARRGRVA